MDSIELRKRRELRNIVEKAWDEAPDWETQLSQTEKDINFFKSFLGRKISLKEFISSFKKIKRWGLIMITLEDMRRYPYELGLPPFGYSKLIDHEERHVVVAAKHNLPSETGIQYAKKGPNAYFYSAYTFVNFIEDMGDELAREIAKKIACAGKGDHFGSMDKAYLW